MNHPAIDFAIWGAASRPSVRASLCLRCGSGMAAAASRLYEDVLLLPCNAVTAGEGESTEQAGRALLLDPHTGFVCDVYAKYSEVAKTPK